MNELLGKLTNLSYEFFGVILPGLIASCFLLLCWAALGPLAPFWTGDTIPLFTMNNLQIMIDSLSLASGISAVVPLIGVCYFLGHIVLWTSRSGKIDVEAPERPVRRLALSLVFHIPKPANSFDPKLQPLYDVVKKNFASNSIELDWRQFYPVVKSYLSHRLPYSLVPTYQNKYTFHRSVVTVSAVVFWFALLTVVGALITLYKSGPQPYWGLLLTLLGGAILLVWGFSSSYMYHWEMFGNTIITEAYSLIYSPKHADTAHTKSSSH